MRNLSVACIKASSTLIPCKCSLLSIYFGPEVTIGIPRSGLVAMTVGPCKYVDTQGMANKIRSGP